MGCWVRWCVQTHRNQLNSIPTFLLFSQFLWIVYRTNKLTCFLFWSYYFKVTKIWKNWFWDGKKKEKNSYFKKKKGKKLNFFFLLCSLLTLTQKKVSHLLDRCYPYGRDEHIQRDGHLCCNGMSANKIKTWWEHHTNPPYSRRHFFYICHRLMWEYISIFQIFQILLLLNLTLFIIIIIGLNKIVDLLFLVPFSFAEEKYNNDDVNDTWLMKFWSHEVKKWNLSKCKFFYVFSSFLFFLSVFFVILWLLLNEFCWYFFFAEW